MEETKKCPYCGEEINAKAKKCKYCGEWLVNQEDSEEKVDVKADNSSLEQFGCVFCLECLALVILVTYMYDLAIWKGVVGYFVLAFFAMNRITRIVLCFFMSTLWGAFAYGFFDSEVAAGIAFVIALILHLPLFMKFKDDIL